MKKKFISYAKLIKIMDFKLYEYGTLWLSMYYKPIKYASQFLPLQRLPLRHTHTRLDNLYHQYIIHMLRTTLQSVFNDEKCDILYRIKIINETFLHALTYFDPLIFD